MSEAPLAGECGARFARVREVFASSFAAGEVGAAVAVTLDGAPVVDLWGGHRDAAQTLPWERDTLACVASTTKGVTATLMHRLVDMGRLDLDAPVAKVWPEFAAAGKEAVTARQILCHRAGLPALREELPNEALYDWQRMTAVLAAEAPWWEPGTRQGYHAVTWSWLTGELLRRLDGRGPGRFLREELAGPLGLEFHLGLPDALHARCAEMIPLPRDAERNPILKLHQKLGDSLLTRALNNPRMRHDEWNRPEWRRAEFGAASGHGTARALARLYGALARGGELGGVRVLEAESVARATAEASQGEDAVLMGLPLRFGLGFMLPHQVVRFGRSRTAFGHPGMGGSIAFGDPENRLGFAYLMNRMQTGMVGDARGFALIRAVYESLTG